MTLFQIGGANISNKINFTLILALILICGISASSANEINSTNVDSATNIDTSTNNIETSNVLEKSSDASENVKNDVSQEDFESSDSNKDVMKASQTKEQATSTSDNQIKEDENSDRLFENKEFDTNKKSNSSTNNTNISKNSTPSLYRTHIEYEPITKEYTTGNIIYEVKAYEIWKSGEEIYKQSMQGQIKINVYTGTSYQTFIESINNGVASFKIPKLTSGSHNVEIFMNEEKKGSSTIKITKAATKITAPSSFVKYKKNNYFNIKVLDKYNNPVNKLSLKVKVYTGKKSKTYTIKTNSKGIAKLNTKKLKLGTHKIIIKTNNANYKATTKNTKITAKKSSKKVNVFVDSKTLKNNYSSIKAVNIFNKPVKKVSLKVKVYTGKKSKTYTIKTNSKGIAKLNTKKLKLGTHKITIKTTNKNYTINKNAKIKVVKKLNNPKLVSLQYYQKDDGYSAKLVWNSEKTSQYQVLKKTINGKFKVISTITANKKTSTYYDNVGYNDGSSYTVREVILKNDGTKVLGSYDTEGLKLINNPNFSVDFQNLKAVINWQAVDGASNYRIYRKLNRDSEFKCIAVVDANQLNYIDEYYKSESELGSILNSGIFADPSFNSLCYTIRACSDKKVDSTTKTSYGLYLKDGDFHLEAPNIVSLKDNQITWGTVPNAEGYLILKQVHGVWEEIAKVNKNHKSTVQSELLKSIDKNAYYSVQAFANKNGEMVYSKFDEGFSLMNYSTNNSKYRILYFGDSITYGSPYKSESSRHIFSMPYRIAQLTGCTYYNPSIPGSTYHDLGTKPDGTNVENTNYYRYRICREVVDRIDNGELPGNWESLDTAKNSEGVSNTKISDYNIVFLSAGTNDYLDNSVLGDENSTNVTTFNGALNHILGKIHNASMERISKGLDAIKVVFVDLFYSDRTYNEKEIHNRDTTPNKIGLLLGDYQDALTKQLTKWANKTADELTFYNFKTRDYNIVNSENCPYTASDNLHFTKFVYGQYGNALAQFLVENVF